MVKLDSITYIISGNAWSASRFKERGILPIIRIQNLGNNKDEKFVYWDNDFDEKFIITEGDMLLSLSGSIKVNIWSGERALLNQRILKISTKPGTSKRWLFWFLSSQLQNIASAGKHALVNNVSVTDIKNWKIPLPPLHIQEQIADTLDKADALRRKDQELLQKYDQLAQSIFYDMFGDPVRNEKGWDVNLLGNLANVQTGPFGSLLHVSDYIIDGTPLVNPTHIVNKKIVPDNRYTITCEKLSSLQTYKLEKYDIIMGRRGEMGRCALVSEIEEGWLCGTGSIIIRPNQKSNPTFLLDLLTSKQMKNEMESNSKGTTMSNLNQSIVGKLPIITPPLKLQLLYQASLKKIAEQTVLIESSINYSKLLFSSLLESNLKN